MCVAFVWLDLIWCVLCLFSFGRLVGAGESLQVHRWQTQYGGRTRHSEHLTGNYHTGERVLTGSVEWWEWILSNHRSKFRETASSSMRPGTTGESLTGWFSANQWPRVTSFDQAMKGWSLLASWRTRRRSTLLCHSLDTHSVIIIIQVRSSVHTRKDFCCIWFKSSENDNEN